jgi:hypothetical protein
MRCSGDDTPGLSPITHSYPEWCLVTLGRVRSRPAHERSSSGPSVRRSQFQRWPPTAAGAPPRSGEGAFGPRPTNRALHARRNDRSESSTGQRGPAPSRIDRGRGYESSQVRPDHVLCCIVRAASSDRRRRGTKALRAGVVVQAFTRWRVNRSWLCGSGCSSRKGRARALAERQERQRWCGLSALDGNKTPVRGRADSPKRATAS